MQVQLLSKEKDYAALSKDAPLVMLMFCDK